mgnify:CR=1 FL=1
MILLVLLRYHCKSPIRASGTINPSTVINLHIPVSSYVSLQVFDISGRLVKTLANSIHQAGDYSVTFNGSELTSGTYFYKLEAGQIQ